MVEGVGVVACNVWEDVLGTDGCGDFVAGDCCGGWFGGVDDDCGSGAGGVNV